MRRWRSGAPAEPDADTEVIDIRERLAPYGHAALRPGWREDLIKEDVKRRERRPKVDQWGFRG